MGDKCEQANVLQKDSNGKAYNTIIHGTKIMLPAIWDIKSQKCSMGKTYGFYIVLDNGGGIQYAVTATGLGGQLTLQPINWGSSQQWQFDNGATNNARIFNSAAPNWYCFGASMSAGTAVTQQQCTSSSTQNWIFYLSTQTIQNGAGGVNTNTNGANGGLGLTASYAGAGATLSLQWTGQSNQKWVLVPAW